MRIWDISLPISGRLPVWPGDPTPTLVVVSSIEEGAEVNVSELRLGTHTGSHLDAPLHLLPGAQSVDQIPLETLIGDAWVCRLPASAREVTAEQLEAASVPVDASRLLLATSNGRLWDRPDWSYTEDYVALSEDGARWVAGRGIVLVGVDYLSVEAPDSPNLPVHRSLLAAGVVIVEGLDLRGVPEGPYQLVCLPLKLAGADGAPVRAVLIEE